MFMHDEQQRTLVEKF